MAVLFIHLCIMVQILLDVISKATIETNLQLVPIVFKFKSMLLYLQR